MYNLNIRTDPAELEKLQIQNIPGGWGRMRVTAGEAGQRRAKAKIKHWKLYGRKDLEQQYVQELCHQNVPRTIRLQKKRKT